MTDEQAAAIAGAMMKSGHNPNLDTFAQNATRALDWIRRQRHAPGNQNPRDSEGHCRYCSAGPGEKHYPTVPHPALRLE